MPTYHPQEKPGYFCLVLELCGLVIEVEIMFCPILKILCHIRLVTEYFIPCLFGGGVVIIISSNLVDIDPFL